MNLHRTWSVLIVLPLLAAGCVSSRVVLQGGSQTESRRPDYVDYFDYYFWGLGGSPSVDLQKVCMEQKPLIAEQARTLEDGVISLFTLGIYSSMTVRVWCGD